MSELLLEVLRHKVVVNNINMASIGEGMILPLPDDAIKAQEGLAELREDGFEIGKAHRLSTHGPLIIPVSFPDGSNMMFVNGEFINVE